MSEQYGEGVGAAAELTGQAAVAVGDAQEFTGHELGGNAGEDTRDGTVEIEDDAPGTGQRPGQRLPRRSRRSGGGRGMWWHG
jgi:hypothetical protein